MSHDIAAVSEGVSSLEPKTRRRHKLGHIESNQGIQ